MTDWGDTVRDCVRLLLRISRAGTRNGWTPELEAVWEQAALMARDAGLPLETVHEIRGMIPAVSS